MSAKTKKIAIYSAAGCRSCDHLLLELQGDLYDPGSGLEIVFWPYLAGSSWEDLAARPQVDCALFAGAIQTVEDQQAAQRLRDKAKILVALGACAAFGGLPGLANLAPASATTQAEDIVPPLPPLLPEVMALEQVVPVDYVIPGCPPTDQLVWAALQALVWEGEVPCRISYAASRLPEVLASAITAGVLPPRGSIFAGEKAVCATCSRLKEEKKLLVLKRPYQEYEASGRCLLEQGLVCQGVATQEGCGGLCPGVGLPCRGCFGKAPAIYDPGAKMIAALSSVIDTTEPEELKRLADTLVDLPGTFYRYTLPTQCALRPQRTR